VLEGDEVHVWSASLDRTEEEVLHLTSYLTPDEIDRSAQLHSTSRREQFIVSRALLRLLLSRYLDTDPLAVAFQYGPQGKPYLPTDVGNLHFNVSHSHGLALYAFARHFEIGVDVERVRPFPNFVGFAQRFFSPREVGVLTTLPDEFRHQAFFHAWTRKEAYLKATGEGISSGLDRVEVSVHPDDPARLIRLNGQDHLASEWAMHSLAPTPGYVGALCLARQPHTLCCRNWAPSEEPALGVA
jgi:4'-phosphopantetheinyl transferase